MKEDPLSYLLVLQSAGLPVYAQSFEFQNRDACQSFNHLIKPLESSPKDAHLMGGFFSAMQLFGDDLLKDKLRLVDLGFTNFEIVGIIRNKVFFIGIFQNFPNSTSDKNSKIEFLEAMASRFIHRYPMDEIQNHFVSHTQFRDFTDIIIEYSHGAITKQNCGECLTTCMTENKGCLPHRFYFENIEVEDRDGMIFLKTDND